MRIFDMGAQEGPQDVSDRIWTVPNILSFARLLILPIVYIDMVSGRLWRALIVAFIFGATDWVDGYVARRFNQVTRLGQVMDPISDRAFIVVLGVAMAVTGLLPWWALILLLARDVIVIIGGLTLLSGGDRPPAVTRTGKAATFGIMFAMAFFTLAGAVGGGADTPNGPIRVLAWFTYWTNVALYYIAAGQYAREILSRPSSPGDAHAGPDADGVG